MQHQRVARMRKVEAEVVGAVPVETVTHGVYRHRSALLRAVRYRIILLAQIGPGLRIVGKGGIDKRRPVLNAETPSVGAISTIVAIPTLQDVKVELDGHESVGLEATKSQSDCLVHR